MTRQEYLCSSIPSKLKLLYPKEVVHKITIQEEEVRTISPYLVHSATKDSRVKPIVRKLDDITKECVQSNYNDGKPFIPMVEFAKIAYPNNKIIFSDELCFIDSELIYDFSFSDAEFKTSHFRGSNRMDLIHTPNQLKLLQQLIKWHFDLITEDCEKIYVTDKLNPYK